MIVGHETDANSQQNASRQDINNINNNQSVAPDGPNMPPPIKKETWVAGKEEGGAGRQSVVPAARLGTVW
jgi:hypothetical protein